MVLVLKAVASLVADASIVNAVRAYLSAVYPAAKPTILSLEPIELLTHYEALDYYYHCEPSSLINIKPAVSSCVALSSTTLGVGGEAPLLPYLPHGAYYKPIPTSSNIVSKPFNDASFTCHRTPIYILRQRLPRNSNDFKQFHSQSGAKVGPAPSWTSPLAIVRYPLHPIGLKTPQHSNSNSNPRNGMMHHQLRPPRELADGPMAFHQLDMLEKVRRLNSLKHGDLIEIEQFGGWVTENCPPICGLWGNVWSGTGVCVCVHRLPLTLPLPSPSHSTHLHRRQRTLPSSAQAR